MTTIRGETIDDDQALPGRYIRLPPAASSHLADANPLAANYAMRAHNNLSVLALQQCRPLAWWSGNATLSQTSGYSGLIDGFEPEASDTTAGDEHEISWSPTVSRHFGPFIGVQDRRGASGEGLLRRVVFEVEVTNAGSLALYIALTEGRQPLPPSLGYIAFEKKTGPSSGVNTYSLDATAPLAASEPLACRNAASTSGAASSRAAVYWAWVGWLSTSGGDRIRSISLYEQRD